MTDALLARDLSVMLGGRPVLRAVSFAARAGEILAIVGPNGAGKSTLLRTLAGLLPYTGEVDVERTELATLSAGERARRVSFVPQQSQLRAALSVREVVALGRYPYRTSWLGLRGDDQRAIDRALCDTDVHELAPRAFHDLSTGEQKRVLLARALCTEARILLLDEPTASLDIEHALSFSDQTLLLQRGAVLASGPTHDVLTPAHVRTLHGVVMVPAAAPGFLLPDEAP